MISVGCTAARDGWKRTLVPGFILLAASLFGSGCGGDTAPISGATTQSNAVAPVAVTKEQLGKQLFSDTTLSNPGGMACISCHDPGTGFSFPNSTINEEYGTAPGVTTGRFGERKVPTIAYATYIPVGPPAPNQTLMAYAGGFFWDGRAATLQDQAQFPLLNPAEMANINSTMVAGELANGPNAAAFEQVYGSNVFQSSTPDQILADLSDALSTYESSQEISPFSSKYDAYLKGKAQLTDSEMAGLQLVTGSTTGRPGGPVNYKQAQCVLCHGIPSDPTTGPDLWSNYCYSDIGVPSNPNNPYYKDPGNTAGTAFVDIGLADFIYSLQNLPSGNVGTGSNGRGDFLGLDGAFKAQTLRNVDKRPSPGFVKAYMHNGYFKSLKDVVHFYNTRNLTTVPGEVIDFTQPNPYAGLVGAPLWPAPEYPSGGTFQNPQGLPGSSSAQVGNLGLTDAEENNIVDFLGTLSDGWSPFP
jgi:cytochrome c peroxidase